MRLFGDIFCKAVCPKYVLVWRMRRLPACAFDAFGVRGEGLSIAEKHSSEFGVKVVRGYTQFR